VIEPRAEEMLTMVRAEIERTGCHQGLVSGVVLTGGGAVLEQMSALAERVFHLPVRLGVPLHLNGLVDVVASPMYSTAVGLVLHGLRQDAHGRRSDGVLGQLGMVRERMMGWLREFF
jgi:cell division protein FtsA